MTLEKMKQIMAPAYQGLDVNLPVGTVLDATMLRALILELDGGDEVCPRWKITGAVFKQMLDLSDGRRRNGNPLPAMEFHECEFKAGFYANGAKLERLYFSRCRFTAETPDALEELELSETAKNLIALRNCNITTELRLEEIPFPERKKRNEWERLLWVDVFAGRIGTNVILKETLLRAPEGEGRRSDGNTRYALGLTNANVGSDLVLQPRVEIYGGVGLRDGRIGGSIWAQALHVTDGESHTSRQELNNLGREPRYSINAQTTVIEGNVIFTPNPDLSSDDETSKSNSSSADLGFDPVRFRSVGALRFLGAQIGGTVELSGAHISDGTDGVNFSGAKIDGQFNAVDVFLEAFPQRMRRPSLLRLKLEYIPFQMGQCRIGANCNVSLEANTLYWNAAIIGGNFSLAGEAKWVLAGGLKVGGDTAISLKNMNACSLEGAQLAGKLDLRDITFGRANDPKLEIQDAEIGHGLMFARTYSGLDAVERTELKCYPGYTLSVASLSSGSDETENVFDKRGSSAVAFLTCNYRFKKMFRIWRRLLGIEDEHIYLLGVNPDPFTELTKRGALSLKTVEEAEEYLRMVYSFRWSDGGPTPLIESNYELPFESFFDLEASPVKARLFTNEKKKDEREERKAVFYAWAYIRSGLYLKRTLFRIDQDGNITERKVLPAKTDDEFVVYQQEEVPKYLPPYRLKPEGSLFSASDFMQHEERKASTIAKRKFRTEVPDWRERLVTDRFQDCEVDLRNAKSGKLNDLGGKVWRQARRVQWDGYEYHGTFSPSNSTVEKEVVTRRFLLRGERDSRWGTRALKALTRFGEICYFGSLLRSVKDPYKVKLEKYEVKNKSWLHKLWEYLADEKKWWNAERAFRAQPYAHLAKVLREQGDDDAARDVEADKIYFGAYNRALGRISGRAAFIVWWTPYGLFFRFGLAPIRALIVLLVLWFMGFAAISMLSESGMLRANVMTVASAAVPQDKGELAAVVPLSKNESAKSLPCGNAIKPALYAVELLTPILNLHQESKCDIDSNWKIDPKLGMPMWGRWYWHARWMEDPVRWEYAKAGYIILGTIMSSLALLTFSGIARRWEN